MTDGVSMGWRHLSSFCYKSNGKLVMLGRIKIKFGMTISMGLIVTKKPFKMAWKGENIIKML